jgi:hypothetical protein
MDQEPSMQPVVETDLVVELTFFAADIFKRGYGRPGGGREELAVVFEGARGL